MNNRFKEAFPKRRHVLLVAIHVVPSSTDTDRDIQVAYDGGADGILLIRDYNTLATNDDVLGAYRIAHKQYSSWWIGLNLLGINAVTAALRIPHTTSGLWFDESRLNEHDPSSGIYLSEVKATSDVYHLSKPPLLMPSVAFKYQRPVKDYAKVVRLAQPHADILITSGEATGKAADLEKIRVMRRACEIPLGLASGVSVDNVDMFMDIGVDCFIVNTSISDSSSGRLDPAKVRELRAKIPRH